MNKPTNSSRRAPATQASGRSRSYAPPKPGPGYNERLAKDLQKRHEGDPRFQVAMFCKHLDMEKLQEDGSPSEREMRFQMGRVLQQCVTDLIKCGGVRLQNLPELSQKHALMLIRYWRQRGDPVGTILWRAAVLRRCFSLLNKYAPLLATHALDV